MKTETLSIEQLEIWFANMVGKRIFYKEWYYISSYEKTTNGIRAITDNGQKLFNYQAIAEAKAYNDSHMDNLKKVEEKRTPAKTSLDFDLKRIKPVIDLDQVEETEDLEFVGRDNEVARTDWFTKPMIKVNCKESRFMISRFLANKMGLEDDKRGLKFVFSYKRKKAYLFPNFDTDSLRPKPKDKNAFRFSSKTIKEKFAQIYTFPEDKNFVLFIVNLIEDDRGFYEILLGGEEV